MCLGIMLENIVDTTPFNLGFFFGAQIIAVTFTDIKYYTRQKKFTTMEDK